MPLYKESLFWLSSCQFYLKLLFRSTAVAYPNGTPYWCYALLALPANSGLGRKSEVEACLFCSILWLFVFSKTRWIILGYDYDESLLSIIHMGNIWFQKRTCQNLLLICGRCGFLGSLGITTIIRKTIMLVMTPPKEPLQVQRPVCKTSKCDQNVGTIVMNLDTREASAIKVVFTLWRKLL